MKWYRDPATRRFKQTHDLSDPKQMTPGELCNALTYIKVGWMSSPYALELCRRAGTLNKWAATHTRRKAIYDAAGHFGFRII